MRHAVNIFKIQPDPEKQPPAQVGEIPAMFEGNQGFDERELRALVYTTSRREDRYILIRNAGTNNIGRMETLRIDPNTCLPMAKSETYDFGGQSHEFFLWHDPANPNRVLVYMTIWTSGLPDPNNPATYDQASLTESLEEFAASVERDLSKLPTIDERD